MRRVLNVIQKWPLLAATGKSADKAAHSYGEAFQSKFTA
jgi:hypothetical protein